MGDLWLRVVAGQCPGDLGTGDSLLLPALLSAVAQTRAHGLVLISASFLPPARRMKN